MTLFASYESLKFESKHFVCSTPGVGYFDDDEIPDLMIHWNYGEWPKYNQSLVGMRYTLNHLCYVSVGFY